MCVSNLWGFCVYVCRCVTNDAPMTVARKVHKPDNLRYKMVWSAEDEIGSGRQIGRGITREIEKSVHVVCVNVCGLWVSRYMCVCISLFKCSFAVTSSGRHNSHTTLSKTPRWWVLSQSSSFSPFSFSVSLILSHITSDGLTVIWNRYLRNSLYNTLKVNFSATHWWLWIYLSLTLFPPPNPSSPSKWTAGKQASGTLCCTS